MKQKNAIRILGTLCVTTLAVGTLTIGVTTLDGNAGTPKATPIPNYFNVPLDTAPYTLGDVRAANLHGFDHTGLLTSATVSNDNTACPSEADSSRWGGTAVINGITITIPCNLIVQMPANTYKWADMVHETTVNHRPSLNNYEFHVVGNIVDGKYVAALADIAEQSLNSGSGFIQSIDYNTGDLKVRAANGNTVRVRLNDPHGRFGRAQSPDPRFSVDDENPSVHAGTGYPMCIPRTDPALLPDQVCPQKNRPIAQGTIPCRTFAAAGITTLPNGNTDISPTPVGQYCTQFVMKAAPGTTTDVLNRALVASNIASTSEPDAREQAPFEVGDYIFFSGILSYDAVIGENYVSAYEVEANLGIYTQPKTLPAYLAIGEFGLGTADPAATAINGAAQETALRIFFETEVTDMLAPVDIYMVDVDPVTGVEHNRWVSQFAMTAECNTDLLPYQTNLTTTPASCYGITGGINTQFYQAQPQRARVRVAKLQANLINKPSRTMRAMVRTMCKPYTASTGTTAQAQSTIAAMFDQATGQSLVTSAAGNPDLCLAGKVAASTSIALGSTGNANGLVAGQYSAPMGEFIFPENLHQGDSIVPFDFWQLPFLRYGEGKNTADGVGSLTPTPW